MGFIGINISPLITVIKCPFFLTVYEIISFTLDIYVFDFKGTPTGSTYILTNTHSVSAGQWQKQGTNTTKQQITAAVVQQIKEEKEMEGKRDR